MAIAAPDYRFGRFARRRLIFTPFAILRHHHARGAAGRRPIIWESYLGTVRRHRLPSALPIQSVWGPLRTGNLALYGVDAFIHAL
jgi:hypothetical protein